MKVAHLPVISCLAFAFGMVTCPSEAAEISETVPESYAFGYEILELHARNFRREQRYANGTVVGSFGYTDKQGLRRRVQYVADDDGFRVNIETNEPGVGPHSPADVVLKVQPVPMLIQERMNGEWNKQKKSVNDEATEDDVIPKQR